jgi:hypothetical protein
MEFVKKIILINSFFILGCGSQIKPRLAPENNVNGFKVTATLSDVNDQSIAIPEISTKPRIFIFASTFCGVCQAEHRNLRDLMAAHNNLLPNNVDIYTVMTGSVDNGDSLDFKGFTNIQWDPLYQVGDELRNQLCGKGTANPCLVIEKPNQGIVFKHYGEVSLVELQSYTGAWSW